MLPPARESGRDIFLTAVTIFGMVFPLRPMGEVPTFITKAGCTNSMAMPTGPKRAIHCEPDFHSHRSLSGVLKRVRKRILRIAQPPGRRLRGKTGHGLVALSRP